MRGGAFSRLEATVFALIQTQITSKHKATEIPDGQKLRLETQTTMTESRTILTLSPSYPDVQVTGNCRKVIAFPFCSNVNHSNCGICNGKWFAIEIGIKL